MVDLASVSARLDWTVWAGVGMVGILLFLVGVYRPALAGLPYASILGIVVAVAGACIAVLGFSFALDQRQASRSRPGRPRRARAEELSQEFGPSFQVYDPATALDSETPPEPESPSP